MAVVDILLPWPRRYLRYLHLREGIRLSQPKNVLVVGIGRGMAEVALAKEFPDTKFHLTDWDFPHRRTQRAQNTAKTLPNVSFSKLDILNPDLGERYDLVASVEVLEHIKEDDQAAANMIELSRQHVFCLVPFAPPKANANPDKRRLVWENNQHHVVGYDPDRLRELFPNPVAMRGVYWYDVATALKAAVKDLTEAEIVAKGAEIKEIAAHDVRDTIPYDMSEAVGIWCLSATGPVAS